MKNRFSEVARNYSKFRPGYPETLFADVTSHCRSNNTAWDTGTGNGQAASHLAQYFNKVYASDISQEQLAHAIPASNISYYVSSAENSQLPAGSIDLIFAAQAAHWLIFACFMMKSHPIAIQKKQSSVSRDNSYPFLFSTTLSIRYSIPFIFIRSMNTGMLKEDILRTIINR
ncbi:MAG: class I SAM-dependent methyltransferase [Saprospiraceae bacterium]